MPVLAILLGRMFRVTPAGHISKTNEPMRVSMGEADDRTVPGQCEGDTGNGGESRQTGGVNSEMGDFWNYGEAP